MAQAPCKATSDGNSPDYKAQRGQNKEQQGCSPEERSRGHQSPTLYPPGDYRVTWSYQGQDLGILVAWRTQLISQGNTVLTAIYAVSLSHTLTFHFQIHLLCSQKENVPVKKITNNETLNTYISCSKRHCHDARHRYRLTAPRNASREQICGATYQHLCLQNFYLSLCQNQVQ